MRDATSSAPAADRREQLLSAAARLFRQRGYHAVGIDQIGAAAGVTGPAMYKHFSSKPALFAEVVETYAAALRTELDARTVSESTPEQVLDAMIGAGQSRPDCFATCVREASALAQGDGGRIFERSIPAEAAWRHLKRVPTSGRSAAAWGLRRQAVSGVLLHLALSRHGTRALRSALCRTMAMSVLQAEIADVNVETSPVARSPLRHSNTREAILAAATVQFYQKGFSRVTLREIGADVGLSASAVSRRFESKDQLISAIFERATGQISGAIYAALRGSDGADAATREILRRYVEIALDFPDLITITSTQVAFLAEPERAVRIGNMRMYIEELAHVARVACPDMSAAEGRLRAGAAYSAINEVAMHNVLPRQTGVVQALTVLAQAIVLGLSSSQKG